MKKYLSLPNFFFFRTQILIPCCKILFIIVAFLQISCNKQSNRTVNKAFYFWRSVFELTSDERNYLNHAQIKKIYLKYFDIDWDESLSKPVIVAPIQIVDTIPDSIGIVPTVFVKFTV